MVVDRIPRGRLSRGSKLGRLAAKRAVSGAGLRLAMIGRSEDAKAVLAERATITAADNLFAVLGSMKGAAMKLGQALSLFDVDLVPESHRERFRQKLAALRDQAPKEPFSTMRGVIEADLGPLSRVFSDFDEDPIAAASIGQVYRARLRDGREVAVKVQYPGVQQAVEADMRNLALLIKLWRSSWPAANTAMLEEFSRNIENELDYLTEARTQHHVAQQFRGHPMIRVPDSVVEYSTPRVLVTEFVHGVCFDQIRGLPADERNRIGELIHRFYIGSLFCHNEFCGDPHPGNVLLGSDGKVEFVDFGLYHRMDPANVEFERKYLRAAAEGKAEELYRLMVDRGVVDANSAVTPQECLDYFLAVGAWHMLDEEIAITPEMATAAIVMAIDPRAVEFTDMKRQMLPPEHLFSRRAEFLTFGILGHLEVTNNWHRIAREWLYGDPPHTDLGREIADWQASIS
ncbi:ABC1 kinase family protein [Mycobacterium talmoniae]|uniref:ATP-binding protein n=1 Tax=Mycobacterium talmoniae TaxID=1858794 RepID=A0A1S1NKM8_9MYCO|nr:MULTISPECIES: AarF/ABC1/UbiB kinase family protein [Mycobacterium]OHV05065.1 ATP-binding protein [Mycobacterium talmoniae]TDH55952.1 AarF/ABC1/UbiB kinase family protein [Mycobacterium eburneum]